MKKIQKLLLIVLIGLTFAYIPSMSFATSTIDENIQEEYIENLKNKDSERGISTLSAEETHDFLFWRSKEIKVSRTSLSEPIKVRVYNSGDNPIDVAIFAREGSYEDKIIGSTKTAQIGRRTDMTWEPGDLRDNVKEITVFFTMYKTAINSTTVIINY